MNRACIIQPSLVDRLVWLLDHLSKRSNFLSHRMRSLLDRELNLISLVVAKNSLAEMFNRVKGQGSICCVNLTRKIGSDVFPSLDMNLKVRVEEDTVSI